MLIKDYHPDDPRYDPRVMPLTPVPVRFAVVGSRDFPSEDMVVSTVYRLPRNAIIVSGGAKGVDTWAEKTARYHGKVVDIYPANWKKYGKSAGFIRNNDIIKNSDIVIAFLHNGSRGTKHSISLAKYLNKPCIIVRTGF